jgi:hypothetical protein
MYAFQLIYVPRLLGSKCDRTEIPGTENRGDFHPPHFLQYVGVDYSLMKYIVKR